MRLRRKPRDLAGLLAVNMARSTSAEPVAVLVPRWQAEGRYFPGVTLEFRAITLPTPCQN